MITTIITIIIILTCIGDILIYQTKLFYNKTKW